MKRLLPIWLFGVLEGDLVEGDLGAELVCADEDSLGALQGGQKEKKATMSARVIQGMIK